MTADPLVRSPRSWTKWLIRPILVSVVVGGVVWMIGSFLRERNGAPPPLWTMDTPPGRVVIAEMSRDGNFVSVNVDRYRDDTSGERLGSQVDVWDLTQRKRIAALETSLPMYHPGKSIHSFSLDERFFAALRLDYPTQSAKVTVLETATGRTTDHSWPELAQMVYNVGNDNLLIAGMTVIPVAEGTKLWVQAPDPANKRNIVELLYDVAQKSTVWEYRSNIEGYDRGIWERCRTAFSLDGRFAATVVRTAERRWAYLIDLRSGHTIQAIPLNDQSTRPMCVFSPDGEVVALSGRLQSDGDQAATEVFDCLTRTSLGRFAGEGSPAFSRDGRLLATIRQWENDTKSIEVVLRRTSNLAEVQRTRIPCESSHGWIVLSDPQLPLLFTGSRTPKNPAWSAGQGTFDAVTGVELQPSFVSSAIGHTAAALTPDGKFWLQSRSRSGVDVFARDSESISAYSRTAAFSDAARYAFFAAVAAMVIEILWRVWLVWLRSIGAIGSPTRHAEGHNP